MSEARLTRNDWTLLLAITIVSASGLVYELLIATAATYLLGNTALQYSLCIGLFIGGMGVGAWVAQFFKTKILQSFLSAQLSLAVFGACSVLAIFYSFSKSELATTMVSYGLAFIIGCLSGIELPILIRLVRESQGLRVLISKVLALDYLGCLLGAVLFPLFLMPALGLIRTAAITAVANLFVAGTILWIFRNQISGWKRRFAVVILTAGGAAFLFSNGEAISSRVENLAYEDPIIFRKQTQYQNIVLTSYNADLRLFLNGHLQFSSRDEYRYHESLVHPAAGLHPNLKSVLLLGAGDGLALRELFRYPSIERVVLVDLDEEVIRLSKEHSKVRELNEDSLRNSKVDIKIDDAFSYVHRSQERFDLVIADLPDPSAPPLAKLYSKEFYLKIRGLLKPKGIFVTQATSPLLAQEAFQAIAQAIEASGFRSYPYQTFLPSFGSWGFVMAGLEPIELSTWKAPGSLRFLNARVLPTLFILGEDMNTPISSSVSTLRNPTVYKEYLKALKREI